MPANPLSVDNPASPNQIGLNLPLAKAEFMEGRCAEVLGVVVPRDEDAGEAAAAQGRLGEARVRAARTRCTP